MVRHGRHPVVADVLLLVFIFISGHGTLTHMFPSASQASRLSRTVQGNFCWGLIWQPYRTRLVSMSCFDCMIDRLLLCLFSLFIPTVLGFPRTLILFLNIISHTPTQMYSICTLHTISHLINSICSLPHPTVLISQYLVLLC